jgi:hypothetical protein
LGERGRLQDNDHPLADVDLRPRTAC